MSKDGTDSEGDNVSSLEKAGEEGLDHSRKGDEKSG